MPGFDYKILASFWLFSSNHQEWGHLHVYSDLSSNSILEEKEKKPQERKLKEGSHSLDYCGCNSCHQWGKGNEINREWFCSCPLFNMRERTVYLKNHCIWKLFIKLPLSNQPPTEWDKSATSFLAWHEVLNTSSLWLLVGKMSFLPHPEPFNLLALNFVSNSFCLTTWWQLSIAGVCRRVIHSD